MPKITFILNDGKEKIVDAEVGISILEVAKRSNSLIPLEGACEGSLACATCHIIIEDKEFFKKSGEISEEEEDLLDIADGLTMTSRLGCQVIVTDEFEGMRIRLGSTYN